MCAPLDGLDGEFTPRGRELTYDIAAALAPTSSAYAQVWTSEDELADTPERPEGDLYGPLYLPRKFKVGVSHPKDNSVDLFTQDVGLMPVVVDGKCDGELWDLYTGGGLGFKHGKDVTKPLLGMFLGRMARDQVVPAIRGIVSLQRDNGERKDRQQARWKYTIRRLGLDAVRDVLRDEFKIAFEVVSDPQEIPNASGLEGWHDCANGTSAYGLSVPAGRLKGDMRKGVREAVETLGLTVRLTTQEDLLLCDVQDREALLDILNRHEVPLSESLSQVRRHAMACPALPTCGLAMTEAERVLPAYCDAIEAAGFGDVDAEIRMTGCPNNCARPVSSEIGLYGFGKNAHVVVVGGAKNGSRLGVALYNKVPGEKIEEVLIGLLRIVKERCPEGQSTGDFLYEAGPEQLRNWLGIDL
jgi:sulfite reductase (ferredoxin)